jgi:hypothetical protein
LLSRQALNRMAADSDMFTERPSRPYLIRIPGSAPESGVSR